MSIAATKWAWDQIDLAGSEKLVLVRLADHAQPDGTSIRPGMRSLMAYTGLSERQIQRYIQGFLDRGLIAYEANEQGGRGHIPTFYIPAVKGDADDTLHNAKRQTPAAPIKPERVTPMTGKGDTHDAKRVTPMTGKGGDSFKEPSLEPSGTVIAGAKNRPAKKTTIPEDFGISERLRSWADRSGFTVAQMESQIERFRNNSLAKGNVYADWDAAFQNWMHNARDWGHLKPAPNGALRVHQGGKANGEAATPDEWAEWRRKRGIDQPPRYSTDEPDDVIDVKASVR